VLRFLLLSVLASSAACVPPRPAQRVAGTYAVWICADACAVQDTAAAPVAGYLVLSDKALNRDAFSDEIVRGSMFFGLSASERAKPACFRLETRPGIPRSLMAGIIPAAITSWTTSGDTVQVDLYASPDAGYTLRALVKDGRLTGVGRESGFIGGSFDRGTGPAHGVRVGDADVTRCSSGLS
jgi:hypothetical protein